MYKLENAAAHLVYLGPAVPYLRGSTMAELLWILWV